MNKAKKADVAMKQVRDKVPGCYPQPMKTLLRTVKHMPKLNEFEVTLRFPADQVCDSDCVRDLMQVTDKVKLVPVLLFIDPDEVKTEE